MGDCSGGLVWVGTSVAWLTEAAYLGWRAGERVPELFQLLEELSLILLRVALQAIILQGGIV